MRKPLTERLAPFEAMWTTERYRYVLSGSRHDGYLPIDISGEMEMAILIDEDEPGRRALTFAPATAQDP